LIDEPLSERDLGRYAARFLKSELKRRDLTYDQLAAMLRERGFKETQASVASKLSRASFTIGFFLGVLSVIGKRSVPLDQILDDEQGRLELKAPRTAKLESPVS
jgi:hypothetical protein